MGHNHNNNDSELIHECDSIQGCGAIEQILLPKSKDLENFSVRRLLPTVKQKMVGPWVFFDHFGPVLFKAGSGVNVRPHPHIGIATVTYLFEGEIFHRDSLGNQDAIQPGEINLMVAGSGIVHSERERPEINAREHALDGLQLWLALPEEQQEIDPAFYHYPHYKIPQLDVKGVPVRVMMGTAYGVTSPVKTFANTLYVEAKLNAGQKLLLPNAQQRGLYVAKGHVKTEGVDVPEYAMAILAEKNDVQIEATTETRIALIGGENLGKRFIDWNFVSTSKERIEQAKVDWKAGRFAKVAGDGEEFIPLPEY